MKIGGIDKSVFQQYEAIRRLGSTNMSDKNGVRETAKICDFKELVEIIDRGDYSKISKNYAKALTSGVIRRD